MNFGARPFLTAFAPWALVMIAFGLAPTATGAVAAGAVQPSLSPGTNPDPAHVVVVANSRSAESVEVAKFYLQRRGIPEKNLVLIDAPTEADVTWRVFVDQIFNPLRQQLTAAGWIDATTSTQHDSEGRWRYVFYGHQIDFLVVCYGVPVRITNDAPRLAAYKGPPVRAEFNTNQAAVDSELSLLAESEPPTAGYFPNALYNKVEPDFLSRRRVVRVARLDGPSAAAAKGLVESALLGESRGVQGRGYIDMTGPNPRGDEWLQGAAQILRQLGYDVSENRDRGLFTWADRFDAPAFYFGWWSWEMTGPIANPSFRFPPGAVAIHIHSFSGEMIRDGTKRWDGPLVARGIAATVGNVFEPYLELTHNPQLFLAALARGRTTGEAAYYSVPALSWQTMFVGDPLYRPFALTLPEQLARADRDPTPYSAYAVIRQMNLLQEQGHLTEALTFGRDYFAKHPGPALALALAQLDQKLGRPEEGIAILEGVPDGPEVTRDDLGLFSDIARWLEAHGSRKLALAVYAKALASPAANKDFLQVTLPEAIAVAKQAQTTNLAFATDLIQRWTDQLPKPEPVP
jgi:uncharacterized protein (TIGR03790 family)